MRKPVLNGMAVALLVVAGLPLTANAADELCDHKAREVKEQLEYARAHNNSHQVKGLQRALNAIESNCTNERVIKDAEEDVRESRQEVEEHQADLEQALDEGNEKDVQEARDELKEARQELQEETRELNVLKERINR